MPHKPLRRVQPYDYNNAAKRKEQPKNNEGKFKAPDIAHAPEAEETDK